MPGALWAYTLNRAGRCLPADGGAHVGGLGGGEGGYKGGADGGERLSRVAPAQAGGKRGAAGDKGGEERVELGRVGERAGEGQLLRLGEEGVAEVYEPVQLL